MLEKCLQVSGMPSPLKTPISLHEMEKTGDYAAQIHNFSIAKLKLADSP